MREGEARAHEAGKDVTAFSFKFFKNFYVFFCCAGSSLLGRLPLVVVGRGHSLAVGPRPLTAVASRCRAQAPGHRSSVAATCRLHGCGSRALGTGSGVAAPGLSYLLRVGSSWTSDYTCVSSTGRWSLYH